MTEFKVGDKMLMEMEFVEKDDSDRPYGFRSEKLLYNLWFKKEEIETAIKFPTLPKIVAEWLEDCKKEGMSIYRSFAEVADSELELHFYESDEYKENQEQFVLAWLFGYEVDTEKRYRVKLPNGQYLRLLNEAVSFGWNANETFTKAEIEQAGFGWVWDVDEIEKVEV